MAEDSSPKPIIFVLGGPGSGKGTHCERIVKQFGYTHLSAGDLLRQEIAKGTERSSEIDEIMKSGKLVPPDWIIELLKKGIEECPKAKGILIDGFPRKLDQAKIFEEQVYPCSLVIMLECSEGTMLKRLLERGKTSGRVDDNEVTIRKRFTGYREETIPVIEHYQSLHKVSRINSERPVEEVYADVQISLGRLECA